MTKPLLSQADNKLDVLTYAVELQKLASSVGFDWDDISGVIAKLHEEIDEVSDEVGITDNQIRLRDEIGDLLFACTNLARHLNVDPKLALEQANQKFYRRFSSIEAHIQQADKDFKEYTLAQLDDLWNQVKASEK